MSQSGTEVPVVPDGQADEVGDGVVKLQRQLRRFGFAIVRHLSGERGGREHPPEGQRKYGEEGWFHWR